MSQQAEQGYYTISKADEDELIKKCSPGLSCRAVWHAMLRLSNDRRSKTFTARISLIAELAGVRYRTAQMRLKELEHLGYVSCTHPVTPTSRNRKVGVFSIIRGQQLSCQDTETSNVQPETPGRKKKYIW